MDQLRSAFCIVATASGVAWSVLTPHAVNAIGYDNDDFLVAGVRQHAVGVFEHDLTFKGYLTQSTFFGPAGLDFDAQGRVVIVDSFDDHLRVFDHTGGEAVHVPINGALTGTDLKVAPNGNYYAPNHVSTSSVGTYEISPAGTLLRTIGSRRYAGVAALPGGILWAGSIAGAIDVFDLSSGLQIDTIFPDHGQLGTSAMFYSRKTNTVLMMTCPLQTSPWPERELGRLDATEGGHHDVTSEEANGYQSPGRVPRV